MTVRSLPAQADTRTETGTVSADDARFGAAHQATQKIAPLWPLKHFVAVNPFLGMIDKPFADAAQTMANVAGARMTMSRSFYAAALGARRDDRRGSRCRARMRWKAARRTAAECHVP